MISAIDEKAVRSLIASGASDFIIELETGVSHQTIGRIRKNDTLLSRISEEKKREVFELLMCRVPIHAIEIRTKVPKSLVIAIRRLCCKCPTCGQAIIKKFDNKKTLEKINDKG